MTDDIIRWVLDWVTETGSLLYVWKGEYGWQPILMPGFTYYWWRDEQTVPRSGAWPLPVPGYHSPH